MATIDTVEGIGEAYRQKLKAAGILTTEGLLRDGATKQGRTDIAQETGIPDALLLDWVNRCDLMRIKGVGEEYSDLLEASGVDTVPELAQRRADNLTAKMQQVNEEKKLVRVVPSEAQVEDWVAQASKLDKVVTH